MPDISDPRVIKFLTESYGKEATLRARWFHLNAGKLSQAAGEGRVLKDLTTNDVFCSMVLPGVEALRISHKESEINRRKVAIRDTKEIHGIDLMRKTHPIKDVGLATVPDPRLDRPDTDLSLDPPMRPVSAEEDLIIRMSKPEYGRQEYLRRRGKKRNEDKFYFSQCYNWDYGWRLSDSRLPELAKQQPNLGRFCALTRESTSRSGPQPDPAHYNAPVKVHVFCGVINE